jgi:integrase/recombinase XerD
MLDLKTFRLRASSVYPETTLRRKVCALAKYDRFLEEKKLKPGIESLSLWVDELRRSGLSPRTVGAYARDVLSYFDFLMVDVDERKLRMFKKTLPPVKIEPAEYLTEDEVAKLISKTLDPRRKLIYLLAYSYSRRISEVLGAKIDLSKNTVTFPILKKKAREFVTYELEPMISELAREHKIEGFNLTARAVEIAFKKDCARAGIKPNGRRLRIHLLRHSRVTHLIERGVPIEVVSKVLVHHSSISTTASFYMAATEKMAEAIPKAEEIFKSRAG